MKDEFVSIVSHELRTPLTSIRGSVQLVLDDAGSVPDQEHRNLLQIALNNCERLVRIINDILDVSKIESGNLTLRKKAVNVADLVRQSIDVVASPARNAGVTLEVNVPANIRPVMVDPDRIVQALVNLLSNAVKFAPAEFDGHGNGHRLRAHGHDRRRRSRRRHRAREPQPPVPEVPAGRQLVVAPQGRHRPRPRHHEGARRAAWRPHLRRQRAA